MQPRVELEGTAPAGLPRGECIITRLADGSLRIAQADPRILISAELLAAHLFEPEPRVSLTQPDHYRNDPRCAFWQGATLTIRAVNQTVVYRVVEYVPSIRGYIAEWPD